jgi:hypothetical protein
MLRAKIRWESALSLRTEVEQVRQQLALTESQFRPLGLREWEGIEERIYHTFCKLNSPKARPAWLWEHFKLETQAWHRPGVLPDFLLTQLVDKQETVWLMLNNTVNESTKFWLYEGRVEAIQQIISECCLLDEIYLISKKYEWLLCIDHHNVLYATGGDMPTKLRQLETSAS